MEEKLVSFETAKLAEKKGFIIKCNAAYIYRNEYHELPTYKGVLTHNQILLCDIYAPTQALLQKWLREVHGIHIQVYVMEKWKDGNSMTIWFEVNLKTTNYLNGLSNVKCNMLQFDTYEEALEQGLFEALKLIKI